MRVQREPLHVQTSCPSERRQSAAAGAPGPAVAARASRRRGLRRQHRRQILDIGRAPRPVSRLGPVAGLQPDAGDEQPALLLLLVPAGAAGAQVARGASCRLAEQRSLRPRHRRSTGGSNGAPISTPCCSNCRALARSRGSAAARIDAAVVARSDGRGRCGAAGAAARWPRISTRSSRPTSAPARSPSPSSSRARSFPRAEGAQRRHDRGAGRPFPPRRRRHRRPARQARSRPRRHRPGRRACRRAICSGCSSAAARILLRLCAPPAPASAAAPISPTRTTPTRASPPSPCGGASGTRPISAAPSAPRSAWRRARCAAAAKPADRGLRVSRQAGARSARQPPHVQQAAPALDGAALRAATGAVRANDAERARRSLSPAPCRDRALGLSRAARCRRSCASSPARS